MNGFIIQNSLENWTTKHILIWYMPTYKVNVDTNKAVKFMIIAEMMTKKREHRQKEKKRRENHRRRPLSCFASWYSSRSGISLISIISNAKSHSYANESARISVWHGYTRSLDALLELTHSISRHRAFIIRRGKKIMLHFVSEYKLNARHVCMFAID